MRAPRGITQTFPEAERSCLRVKILSQVTNTELLSQVRYLNSPLGSEASCRKVIHLPTRNSHGKVTELLDRTTDTHTHTRIQTHIYVYTVFQIFMYIFYSII